MAKESIRRVLRNGGGNPPKTRKHLEDTRDGVENTPDMKDSKERSACCELPYT